MKPSLRSRAIIYLGLMALVASSFSFSPIAKAAEWSQELLANGDFEATPHNSQWYQYQSGGCATDCLITNAPGAYSGSYYAKLGSATSTSDYLAMPGVPPISSLALPANASKIYLSYYYKIISDEPSASDSVAIYLWDFTNFHAGPFVIYFSHDNNIGEWTSGGIDLTLLKGKSVNLQFAVSNSANPATPTYFYLDKVSLKAYYNDVTRPTGSISINSGKKTTKKAKVTLTLSATDDISGVVTMRFSNNGKKWSSWKTYRTTYRNWKLTTKKYGGTTKKGKKRVYVQFKDGAGNISKKRSDSIRYR